MLLFKVSHELSESFNFDNYKQKQTQTVQMELFEEGGERKTNTSPKRPEATLAEPQRQMIFTGLAAELNEPASD